MPSTNNQKDHDTDAQKALAFGLAIVALGSLLFYAVAMWRTG